jgi:hypothetical protein
MRSYHGTSTFFKKMKKKPALQLVLDNIENYTAQELADLRGSHFPQWIRDELVELKKRNGSTADDMASIIAEQMIKASQK